MSTMEDNPVTVRYFDIDWLSRNDGPGRRVVLFLQGCNLVCPWCHSPHSRFDRSPVLFFAGRCLSCGRCAEVCPADLHVVLPSGHTVDSGRCQRCGACVIACPVSRPGVVGGALVLPTRDASVDDLFAVVLPQLELVRKSGGLTLSGGEALLQHEAAARLLMLAKKGGIHTAVETSGLLPLERYEAFGDLVDCWLFGLRSDLSGSGAKERFGARRDNLRYLASLSTRVIIRKPLVAGLTDTAEEIEVTAELMAECGVREINLLPLNPHTGHYYRVLCQECPPEGRLVPTKSAVATVRQRLVTLGYTVTCD